MNWLKHLFVHDWVYLVPGQRQCRYCGVMQRRVIVCRHGEFVERWVRVPALYVALTEEDYW
jgi:hypothetical protein